MSASSAELSSYDLQACVYTQHAEAEAKAEEERAEQVQQVSNLKHKREIRSDVADTERKRANTWAIGEADCK